LRSACGAAGGADEDVLQDVRILPVFWRRLHDDVILVERIVDCGNLALAEGIVKRVVDLVDRKSESRRRRPIDRDVRLEPVILLIAVGLRQGRKRLQFREDPWRPCKKLVRAVVLQGVLILCIGGAAPDTDVLYRLEIQRCSGNLRNLATQPADHLIGRYFTHAKRLERNEGGARIGGIAAARSGARKSDHGLNRLVFSDDRDELLKLLAHQLKRNSLVGHYAARNPAGVLLRKKSLWHDHKEIEIETERDGQDQHDQQRVSQRPGERSIVAAL
jgi:hypothetical protein